MKTNDWATGGDISTTSQRIAEALRAAQRSIGR